MQPNILWIIVDHMAFAGHYRQRGYDYHWPELEAIAAQGAWFERAYTTVPVCTPARASLMSGQRPGKHGMRWNPEYAIAQNRSEFWPEQRLLPHRLQEQGYDTRFVGKWHCGRDKLPSDYGMGGWSLPDYGNVYASERYKQYLRDYGLSQPVCRIDHNLFDPSLDGRTVTLDPPEPWTYMDGCGVIEGSSMAQEQHFVAQLAIEELQQLKQDRPWCMIASLWGPHHPYIPSEEFANQVNPKDIPPYPSFGEDLLNKPLRYGVHRDLRCDFRAHERWPQWSTWQTIIARCYAQGLQTDAAIGMLARAVPQDTLLVISADHGDAIASHGAGWDKYSSYSEEVGRIPLVLRWPEHIIPGQRRQELVSGLDIPATLADASQADSADLDGESVLPLLRDEAAGEAAWREHLVVEHYGHSGDVCFQRIVYWQHWKYVAAYGDDDELYDLASDPFELQDRQADSPDILQAMRQRALDDLVHERAEREQPHPQREMEHKLVVSNARWPREERLLMYKLQRALAAPAPCRAPHSATAPTTEGSD